MRLNLVIIILIFVFIIAGVYLVSNLNTRVDNEISYTDFEPTFGKNHGMNHGIIGSEKDFIKEMIPHHQEAVTTSKYVLSKYPNTKIKEFLENVIKIQTAEIETMKTWYKQWFNEDYVDAGTYVQMMTDLELYTDAQLETQYITGMISHHEAAIMMARNLMPIVKHEELRSMANSILSTQSQEIVFLKSQY